MFSSERPAVFARSLWQVMQYRSTSARGVAADEDDA
jgi:hypothetical protein